jgi:hypothetical protein
MVRFAWSLLIVVAAVCVISIFGTGDALAQRAAITKNVDEPGRQPYEAYVEFGFPTGCIVGCSNFFTGGNTVTFELPAIPTGKRFIIRHVSGVFPTTSLSEECMMSLQNSQNKNKWAFYGPFYPFALSGTVRYSSDAFTTYGPGEAPHVYLFVRDLDKSSPAASYSLIVGGYLIDAN